MTHGSQSTNDGTPLERHEELLIDDLLDGLTGAERQELDALGVGDDGYADVVASLQLLAVDDEPLPAGLEQAILVDAGAGTTRVHDVRPAVEAAASTRPLAWAGWLAAAGLAFALIIPSLQTPAAAPTLAEQRAALLDRAETLSIEWTRGADETAASAAGSVVWNTSTQTGFMAFEGLAKNDPAETQYQLWIFDAEQDERYPIDGGVFDVTGDRTIVPIVAKLNVTKPTLFAITIEKPGGVVVSTRERLPLLAPVPTDS